GAQGFELRERVLSLMSGPEIAGGADAPGEIHRDTIAQSGFESSPDLLDVEPRVEAEAQAAGGEDAALGRMFGDPAGQLVLDGALGCQRQPVVPSLRAIGPELRHAGEEQQTAAPPGTQADRLVGILQR